MTRIWALLAAIVLAVTAAPVADAQPLTRTPERQRAVDYVVARALAARGVPFVYGGGNAAGPTLGSAARDAAAAAPTTAPALAPRPVPTVAGFDASGLTVYAYAGVGVALPRSSSQQYLVGRKVLPAQAVPGDLIFYGPDGSQSVTMFVGNSMMVEATDPYVTVSAVRFTNMAPYLVRVID